MSTEKCWKSTFTVFFHWESCYKLSRSEHVCVLFYTIPLYHSSISALSKLWTERHQGQETTQVSNNRRMDEQRVVYLSNEIYSTTETISCSYATIWRDLKSIIWCESSQMQSSVCLAIMLVWSPRMGQLLRSHWDHISSCPALGVGLDGCKGPRETSVVTAVCPLLVGAVIPQLHVFVKMCQMVPLKRVHFIYVNVPYIVG